MSTQTHTHNTHSDTSHRYSDKTDGYHWFQLDASKSKSATGLAFKKYQQDAFLDVALDIRDLPAHNRPADPADFKMCPMVVENGCVLPSKKNPS